MVKICLVLVLLVAAGVRGGVAAEIDSVTPRGLALDDSLAVINALVNARLERGVARANARQDDYEDLASDEFCEEQVLYTELRKAIFQSLTASWGLKGYALDQQLMASQKGGYGHRHSAYPFDLTLAALVASDFLREHHNYGRNWPAPAIHCPSGIPSTGTSTISKVFP